MAGPPPGGGLFLVTMRVQDALNYGALQWNVDYSGAPGVFSGSGATVLCNGGGGLGPAIVTFNDDEPA